MKKYLTSKKYVVVIFIGIIAYLTITTYFLMNESSIKYMHLLK